MFGKAMGAMMGMGAKGMMGQSKLPNTQMQPQKQQFGQMGSSGSQGMGGAMMAAQQGRNWMNPSKGAGVGGPNQNYMQQFRGLGPSLNNVSPMMQKPEMSQQMPQQDRGDDYMYDPGNGMPKTPFIPTMKPQPGGLGGDYRMHDMGPNNIGGRPPMGMGQLPAIGMGSGINQPYGRPDVMPRNEDPYGMGAMGQPRGIGPSSPYEQMLQMRAY